MPDTLADGENEPRSESSNSLRGDIAVSLYSFCITGEAEGVFFIFMKDRASASSSGVFALSSCCWNPSSGEDSFVIGGNGAEFTLIGAEETLLLG